jgi:transcriptional regulator NrdR family protein
MKCPVCGTWVMVKETRAKKENVKYRRYECANEHRFTTLEKVERVIEKKEKP